MKQKTLKTKQRMFSSLITTNGVTDRTQAHSFVQQRRYSHRLVSLPLLAIFRIFEISTQSVLRVSIRMGSKMVLYNQKHK